MIHESEKQEEYYSQALKKYHKKKKMRWAIWNVKKLRKIYQVNKFSKKFDSKSKSLKTEQEKVKEKMKATSFW